MVTAGLPAPGSALLPPLEPGFEDGDVPPLELQAASASATTVHAAPIVATNLVRFIE
jgi:hypothetical protein